MIGKPTYCGGISLNRIQDKNNNISLKIIMTITLSVFYRHEFTLHLVLNVLINTQKYTSCR